MVTCLQTFSRAWRYLPVNTSSSDWSVATGEGDRPTTLRDKNCHSVPQIFAPTYQHINSATHSIVNVVIAEYHSPVVQQSFHQLGDQPHKSVAIFFKLRRLWLEQFQQAEVKILQLLIINTL